MKQTGRERVEFRIEKEMQTYDFEMGEKKKN